MEDSLNQALDIVFGVIGLSVALAILWMAIGWCVRDARRREKSPVLVCLAVILFFPWGLLAWLVFRPEPSDVGKGRLPFRLDHHRLQ
jgi:hypothetical protein